MSARPSTQAVEAPTRTESGSWAETTDLRVPGLTIAWHPDPARIGDRVALTELAAGREASLSRLSPAFFPAGGGEPRPLEDTFLSRSPMLLSLQEGGAGGMTLSPGQARTRLIADGEPVEGRRSFSRAELERGVALLLADRVLLLLHLQLPFSLERPPSYGLVGESASLGRVRTAIARVADLEVPVLLSGETGTGKELVAQALHVAGPRRKGPFLTINLGAVPTSLAASELFGAASGAFTGAQRRRAGYFEQAHGGTLFLDEIGEAPSEVQVLLLRALETGEIQPVGAESPRRADVRLISATDADLERACEEGRFRAPLLHRLAGYQIALPPLRERREDIGLLLKAFLLQELAALGEEHRLTRVEPGGKPWLAAPLVDRLLRRNWPGNVRQLKNFARRLAIGSRGRGAVSLELVQELLAGEGEAAPPEPVVEAAAETPTSGRKRYRQPEDVGEGELLAALEAHAFRLKPAAAALGVARPTLYAMIERHPELRTAARLSDEDLRRAIAANGDDLEAAAVELKVSASALRLRLRGRSA